MSTARPPRGITDHDLFVVQPNDHHAEVEVAKIINNGISIPPGDYVYRVAWNRANHRITEACLAGPNMLVPGGRKGAWNSGTQTPQQSGGEHVSGAGSYVYVASFMRLHGDAYISLPVFGTGIRWKDIWLDGADTVILMHNSMGTNQTMRFWGICYAK